MRVKSTNFDATPGLDRAAADSDATIPFYEWRRRGEIPAVSIFANSNIP
jgi:hypothetical protein